MKLNKQKKDPILFIKILQNNQLYDQIMRIFVLQYCKKKKKKKKIFIEIEGTKNYKSKVNNDEFKTYDNCKYYGKITSELIIIATTILTDTTLLCARKYTVLFPIAD